VETPSTRRPRPAKLPDEFAAITLPLVTTTASRSGPLTAVDLFCGAGGLTRGLIDAGFEVLGAIEMDALAAESFHANFPTTRLWESDIRSVPAIRFAAALDLAPGMLDLLAACPPCEGFSTMRTLNGCISPEDPRNDLVLELIRYVRRLKPKILLVENVPALAEDSRLINFRRELHNLGYQTRCEIINAADYGVPQRRRRMLLLASRFGGLPNQPVIINRTTVRDWIGSLPKAGLSGDPLHDHGESRSKAIKQLIRLIPADGGGRDSLPHDFQLACHKRVEGFHDVYGRMAWDDVAPTITSGCVNPSKGRFLHPVEHRTITLREAALLQTFPADHKFSLRRGKFAAAEMIGNALPPLLVKVQASAVAQHIWTVASGGAVTVGMDQSPGSRPFG